MALDTRNRRSSAIDIESPWRDAMPVADGAIDQADRQHVCFAYAGILFGEATPEELEYLPRIDVYGSYSPRVDAYGGLSPRLLVDGAQSPRLSVFGGEGE